MKNLSNIDIEGMADEKAQDQKDYISAYRGFIDGWEACLDHLQKEYREIYISTDAFGGIDVLARRKDVSK